MYFAYISTHVISVLAGTWKVQDIFTILPLITTMITISHTFQYKIVLKIFNMSAHLSQKIRQWPMDLREPEHCVFTCVFTCVAYTHVSHM